MDIPKPILIEAVLLEIKKRLVVLVGQKRALALAVRTSDEITATQPNALRATRMLRQSFRSNDSGLIPGTV